MTSVNTYVILCVAVAFAHSARAKMGGLLFVWVLRAVARRIWAQVRWLMRRRSRAVVDEGSACSVLVRALARTPLRVGGDRHAS